MVVIGRDAEATVGAGCIGVDEEVMTSVDIDDRHDIKTRPVHEPGDFGVLPVVAEEVIEQVERNIATLDFVAVYIAVDIDPGFVQGSAGLRIINGHDVQRSPLFAFPGDFERRELRKGAVQGLQGIINLVERIVMIEAQRNGDLRLVLGMRKRECRQQKSESDEFLHFAPPRSTVRESRQAVCVSALISILMGFSA